MLNYAVTYRIEESNDQLLLGISEIEEIDDKVPTCISSCRVLRYLSFLKIVKKCLKN